MPKGGTYCRSRSFFILMKFIEMLLVLKKAVKCAILYMKLRKEVFSVSKTDKKFEDYFKIIKHKLPYWDELPEIDLYMDQVVALM